MSSRFGSAPARLCAFARLRFVRLLSPEILKPVTRKDAADHDPSPNSGTSEEGPRGEILEVDGSPRGLPAEESDITAHAPAQKAGPSCDNQATCCPQGLTAVLGSAGNNIFFTSTPGICYLGLAGNDAVQNNSPSGAHAILGGPGADSLQGGFGPGLLDGGDGGDVVNGRGAADEIYGRGGNDNINGSGGADFVDAGDGVDNIQGGSGDDILQAGAGNDNVNGGDGNDGILGNVGDDTLSGGSGNDVIYPGPGRDLVDAGPGNDTIVISGLCTLDHDTINGGPGTDTLISPLTAQELQQLGVLLTSIEHVTPPDDGAVGGCHGVGSLLIECECCDDNRLDPASGCSDCGPGFVSADPYVEGDGFPLIPRDVSCVPVPTCATFDCGPFGTCTTAEDGAVCVCQPGHAGVECDRCGIGFRASPSGDCVAIPPDSSSALHASAQYITAGSSLTLSVPEGSACAGGQFEWQSSAGTLEVSSDSRSATLSTPDLPPGQQIDLIDVETTCSTSQAVSLTAVVSATASGVPVTGTDIAGMEPFDEAVLDYLDLFGIRTGATLAVVKDNELVYLRGYRYRAHDDESKPMTPCLPMRIASVSKVFTRTAFRLLENVEDIPFAGTLALLTDRRDIVQLDDFVNTFGWRDVGTCPDLTPAPGSGGYPPPTCYALDYIVPESDYDVDGWATGIQGGVATMSLLGFADPGLASITIQHLLRHESGLLTNVPTDHPNLIDPANGSVRLANSLNLSSRPGFKDAIRYAVGASLQFAPGYPFGVLTDDNDVPISGYSNAGYSLLAAIVEWATGRSFFDVVASDLAAGSLRLTLGTNSEVGDFMLYPGKGSMDDVNLHEPIYFSIFDVGPDENTLVRDGGQWKTSGVALPPYALDFSVKTGEGDLVANVQVLGELIKRHIVGSGRKYMGTLSYRGGGTQIGSLPGTRAFVTQLPHSEYPLFKTDAMGFPITCSNDADCNVTEPQVYRCQTANNSICVVDPQLAKRAFVGPCENDGINLVTVPSGVAVALIVAQRPEGYDASDGTCGAEGQLLDEWESAWWIRRMSEAAAEVEASSGWPSHPLSTAERTADCDLCGNDVIDPEFGEVCDGTDLVGKTCESFGFAPGDQLQCAADCTAFDTNACELCGNDAIDPGEACDGANFLGKTCADFGFPAGFLECTDECVISDSGCTTDDPPTEPPTNCEAGRELGCVCGPLDPVVDPLDPNSHPDGNFSHERNCRDDVIGVEAVCVAKTFSGLVEGVCVECTGQDNDEGCTCESDEQCKAGLFCAGEDTSGGGTGHCYDIDDGPPTWACYEDCHALLGTGGYCFNNHFLNRARCEDVAFCAEGDIGVCASEGQLCRDFSPEEDGCTTECVTDTDCDALGYPPNQFECDFPVSGGLCWPRS